MHSTSFARILLVGAITLAAVYGCDEKTPQNAATQSAATSSEVSTHDSSASGNAVHVYIDKKTGQPRDPTAEELATEAALEAQKKQAAAASSQSEQAQSREVLTPSGAYEIKLDKSHQHPLQACVEKNGAVKVDHQSNRGC